MGEYKDYWDSVHTKFYVPKNVIYGNWLNNYKTLIDTSKDFVIDLGCGVESKIEWLIKNGNKVLAVDYSDVAIESAEKEFPEDIRNGNLKLICYCT